MGVLGYLRNGKAKQISKYDITFRMLRRICSVSEALTAAQ